MDLSVIKSCADRLSSLPDELICQILSLLPTTKGAVVASLSSKKIRSTITHLTTLDFDDSPIAYCAKNNPQFIDRFQVFKVFVDNVLEISQSPRLSRFRLGFGGDCTVRRIHTHQWSSDCGRGCYPDLESTHLNAWISFPLSRGVREIDLRIHVREPCYLPTALFACDSLEVLKLDTNLDFELVSDMASFSLPNLKVLHLRSIIIPEVDFVRIHGRESCYLPSALFACDSLEVLKLDTNLDFELVSAMRTFSFPNLKVLQLHSIIIPEDDFVGRLISKCPSLEELYMDCWWKNGKTVTISSHSLQKLVLIPNKDYEYEDQSDLLNIDTPNLQCFEYYDLLAVNYSVPSMNALVEASIEVYNKLPTLEGTVHSLLSLMRAMCNVQHLNLMSLTVEALDIDELKNELPVFNNLTHLEIGYNTSRGLDIMWLEFLKLSPILETLVFPKGIDPCYTVGPDRRCLDMGELELRLLLTNLEIIPTCCKSHLKRIVIKEYRGTERDLEVVGFLLKNASVLEELLIICQQDNGLIRMVKIDPSLAESTLKKLPMASSTCLMTVQ